MDRRAFLVLSLAVVFSTKLYETIGIDNLKKVVNENNKRNDDSCASHDYCDANEIMIASIDHVKPFLCENEDEKLLDDMSNEAWEWAKNEGFFINKIFSPNK